MDKQKIKTILGELPYTAELYWHLVQRQKPWQAHFNLDLLESVLPEAVQQAESFVESAVPGKRVFIFTSLHYWIEYATLLGVALAGKGHKVTFSFLPYASYDKPVKKFDLRQQNLYARQVLRASTSLMQVQSLLDVRPFSKALPSELINAVEKVSTFDTQYTLQMEDITKEEDLYKLRYERNLQAAQNARAWLAAHRPDVVIIPNGTIQEMGIVYQVARYLDIPTVTFEFGDQRERIWLAQDEEIMQQRTDNLWTARGVDPLNEAQLKRLQDLLNAREGARAWNNFTRLWQNTPTEGCKAVRKNLGLDKRPVILLATNVVGDSLTLGRQVFNKTMTDWFKQTIRYFSGRDDIQLVIRVHPGETLLGGPSLVDVVKAEFDTIPSHVFLIEPGNKINTYDLVDNADLGLVYTTTVGLEMAMQGIPVIVAGQTHYRNRGFTYDPASWDEYYSTLDLILDDLQSASLTQEQVERSWRYAYLFFFVFPQPFPWHLLDLQEDIKSRPIGFVLGDEGAQKYGESFDYLTGKPLDW
jgi:hypothetical protein